MPANGQPVQANETATGATPAPRGSVFKAASSLVWGTAILIAALVLAASILVVARRLAFRGPGKRPAKPVRKPISAWQQSADRMPLEDTDLKEEPDRP